MRGQDYILVSGGTAYDDEDGEYTGSAGIKADGYFDGGTVEVYAQGSNYGSNGGGGFPGGGNKMYLTGGTLVAIGGLETGSSLSQSCYSAASWSQNTWYAMTVDGTTWAFMTPSRGGTSVSLSSYTSGNSGGGGPGGGGHGPF